MSKVTLVKTEDRKKGVESAIKSLGTNPVNNKHILIKPNFNTADTVPGSTNNETLLALVDEIRESEQRGNVFLCSSDQVAIDAVGIAILKVLGSNDAIMRSKIFDQRQIKRAVELGLGASSPSDIEVFPADPESQEYRDRVVEEFMKG